MELTWFGTAGFRIKTDKYTLFIDPYLSSNDKELPRQSLKPSDIQDGDVILISHGHFDHIYDVPTISSNTGAKVYCGDGIGEALIRNGMEKGILTLSKSLTNTLQHFSPKWLFPITRTISFHRFQPWLTHNRLQNL